MIRTFRALTTTVRVEMTDDLEYLELANALIGTYAVDAGPPELTYKVTPSVLVRNGIVVRELVDPNDALAVFELDLYEQVIARTRDGWLLHAGAVELDGHALVFAGPSGAGKTTLVVELVARGLRLLTEEMVLVDADGIASGLARPLHVLPAESIPSGWRRVPYPATMRTTGKPALALPPPDVFVHDPIPCRALIHLTHGEDREPGLSALSGTAGFRRLWDSTLRPDDAGLLAASACLRQVPAFRLASRRFSEALEALAPLLTRN